MVCSIGVGTVAEYYLSEQAEYYTDGKEPVGRWYAPSGQLGLTDGGDIDPQMFSNLHSGFDTSGQSLGRSAQSPLSKRVGGYDLTFSAPKSVSVLWAVGDDETRSAIEGAQESATRAVLSMLNEHAGYARRGKGGSVLEKVQLTGATFQHGEARPVERADGSTAVDPQLHTHAVIFNLAERVDRSWGAVDGRHFFKWKMAAGAIYRAHLAHNLRQSLGVEIEVTDDGLFEVAGVPKNVRDHFSARRQDIERELSERGLTARDAQSLAAQITKQGRQTKSGISDSARDRHERWSVEAASHGFDRRDATACLGREAINSTYVNAEAAFSDVPRSLTEHEATFRLEALYRAVAGEALRQGYDGRAVGTITAGLLQNGVAIEIGEDEAGLPVYSTADMLQVEMDLVKLASTGASRRKRRQSPQDVMSRIEQTDLTEEQKTAVQFVTTGGDVAVLEGAAGAGKTHALKSVAEIYKEKGYRIIGTSTAWRMANQLGDDLEIESRATDSWLALEKAGGEFLDANTVLVVDEAGQLSSRQMLQILDAADRHSAKLVLTGDQKQLQAVGAGPGLRLVAEQAGVVRIDTIMRQRAAWARDAVRDLSVGRSAPAIAAFEEHGDFIWCDDERAAVSQAIRDWKVFKQEHPGDTALLMAKTNTQVGQLNNELRGLMREMGVLGRKEANITTTDGSGKNFGLALSVGDQVLFKKRMDVLGVINGTVGSITDMDGDAANIRLSVKLADREVSFRVQDVQDDKGRLPLAHGYASTIYSAQGATVDAAFVVVDDRLKRNEVYVAASRARGRCRLYVDTDHVKKSVRAGMDLSDSNRSQIPLGKLRDHLVGAWSRPQEKNSTFDYGRSAGKRIEPGLRAMVRDRAKNVPQLKLPTLEIGR